VGESIGGVSADLTNCPRLLEEPKSVGSISIGLAALLVLEVEALHKASVSTKAAQDGQ